MIVHKLLKKQRFAVITAEDADDIWILRRVIKEGDIITASTTRLAKRVNDYSRPDRGERIRVNVRLLVEKIKLDNLLNRLRIHGKIIEADSELVQKGSYHSLAIYPGYSFKIEKPKGFSEKDVKLLTSSKKGECIIVACLDYREAGVGIIVGSNLRLITTIHSEHEGKMYYGREVKKEEYYKNIEKVLNSFKNDCKKLVLIGAGEAKREFANFLKNKGHKFDVNIVDGVDASGLDGVYLAVRNSNVKKLLKETKMGKIASILDEALERIRKGDERVAISFKDVNLASRYGAVDKALISNVIFKDISEVELIEVLENIEKNRGEAYLVDESTDLGKQVNGLGGAVALLRFKANFIY
jgi:protein pelota